MDLFQDLIERELTNLHEKVDLSFQENMTHAEKLALTTLSSREDIIIRMADKGCAITVLDRGLYNILNVNMLNDINTYCPLSSNPTSAFLLSLRHLLDEAITLGALSPIEADKLIATHPVVPI